MPNIAYGDAFKQNQLPEEVINSNFDYTYPMGLNFKPGEKLHDDIVGRVLQRARESANSISKRYPSWNNIDRVLTTYALTDDDEEKLQSDDSRKPVTIVFPYSFVIMESMLSYLIAAFFQNPIFRYEGVSPEDIVGATLMQYVIQLHCNRSKVPLALHTMFRDSLSYGMGVGAPGWRIDTGYKTRKRAVAQGKLAQLMGIKPDFERYVEEATLYEGNELNNIDPYMCLPDPNKPIHQQQDGEFFGYMDITNYPDLLSEEKDGEELFNVKYLKNLRFKKSSILSQDSSARNDKFGGTSLRKAQSVTSETDVLHMFVKVIPKDWELGDSEYPEKWDFAVAADSVLIQAKPLGLNHNKFPITVAAPDFDGYSTTPVSRLETLYGLQHILDWLFNTHIKNVRKAINDMFVVDPYSINVNDLKSPKPGKIIRTRRPVWGKGVKDTVAQLAVNDITRANIQDSAFIMEYMEKVGSTSEAMMGHLRKSGPERLTGAEFEGTSKGAISRLERVAKIIGIQAMQDIGYFFAAHTQQLLTEDTYIRTVGSWPETLMKEFGNSKRVKVSPFDLLVDYDLFVRDGSIPGGNFSGVWMEMFKVLSEHPELQKEFDSVRIFKHIARNSGAKDVEEFVRTKTMPDEEIVQQADKGNIVPMGGRV
jgi:hypothetical protein